MDIYIDKKTFSVNTVKNKELELEITDKLESEFNKKNPRMCQEFVSRVLDK